MIKIEYPAYQPKIKAAGDKEFIFDEFRKRWILLTPEEWVRQFDAWVNSHDPNIPVLSDEAMSRESIYPDLT